MGYIYFETLWTRLIAIDNITLLEDIMGVGIYVLDYWPYLGYFIPNVSAAVLSGLLKVSFV